MAGRSQTWLKASGAVIALVVCALVFRGWIVAPPESILVQAVPSELTATAKAVPAPADEARAVFTQGASLDSAPPLDESWRAPSQLGSAPDGEIRFDEQGRLISDRSLRRRFDDLLSAIGEVDLDILRARFAQRMIAELGPEKAEAVLRELDLYIDYLRAVDGLNPGRDWGLAQRVEHLADLQQRVLGSERADAWFGEENRYVEKTLRRLAGESDEGQLDEVAIERAAALAESTEHHLAVEQSRQFEALAVSPEQRFEERSALFNEQAALRLAELDEARASWQSRLDGYQRERAALMAQMSEASAVDRERALQDLLQVHFDDAERRRVLALEDAGVLPGSG